MILCLLQNVREVSLSEEMEFRLFKDIVFIISKKYSSMDNDSKNNGSPAGCLNSTAGIISAIAALVVAMTGFIVATSSGRSGGGDRVDSPSSFLATSHCSARNVNGYGKSSNVEDAKSLAVGNCIRNGGVPACCANDVSVSQN
jgi:hypothetical protein